MLSELRQHCTVLWNKFFGESPESASFQVHRKARSVMIRVFVIFVNIEKRCKAIARIQNKNACKVFQNICNLQQCLT